MFRLLAVLLGVACVAPSALADEWAKLVGTWRLTAFAVEYQATGERRFVMGTDPRGYAIFTPEGRVMFQVTAAGRKPAQSIDEQAALHRSMMAYVGKYSVAADRLTINVDGSWNEAWTGTDQVRFFKVDGDRLDVNSAWAPSRVPLPSGEKPIVRGIVSFQREK